MADISHGPVSSMPGSNHSLPEGTLCDGYNVDGEHEVLAVARIQGETDSFGCEYNDYCQNCIDKMEAEAEAERNTPSCCDWCKKSSVGCLPTRDYDEGLSGPLYSVCRPCRAKQQADAQEELDYMRRQEGCDDDD